jgi:hypothetical protein
MQNWIVTADRRQPAGPAWNPARAGPFTAALIVAGLSGCVAAQAAGHEEPHPVDAAQLSALIRQADRIVVFERPFAGSRAIYTSTAHADIEALNDALQVAPDPDDHSCLCADILTVRLYRADRELVSITNHHGRYIGCSIWSQGAVVTNPDRWLAWFTNHGMPRARREFDAEAAAETQSRLNYARWVAAAPVHARPFLLERHGVDINGLREALANGFPGRRERIVALFGWFGSGAGPWSGFPANESIAEDFLLELPTADLVAAAARPDLSDAQLEGAARLFGGWPFGEQRPRDLKLLPPALKKKLLAHSLKSSDPDKLARAKQAFAH